MPWESPGVREVVQLTSHKLNANFGRSIGEIATGFITHSLHKTFAMTAWNKLYFFKIFKSSKYISKVPKTAFLINPDLKKIKALKINI